MATKGKNSPVWDTKTRKVMQAIRAAVHPSPRRTISAMQTADAVDVAVGPMWVSRVVMDKLDTDDLLLKFMKTCSDVDNNGDIEAPTVEPIRGEWVGYRENATSTTTEPEFSEYEKYKYLMKDVSNQVTILYLHGGGFMSGSAESYRRTTSGLARRTGGRCFVVNYRLSPQKIFPTALLDCLLAYLYLLYPPQGAYHTAVPSSQIVVTGDSAGANLAMALLQVILRLRSEPAVEMQHFQFNHSMVSLPLPAGFAGLSVYGDFTLGLPSWFQNAHCDYFNDSPAYLEPDFPQCEIWPSNPARAATYCKDSLLCHPLVSPTLVESWAGSTPIWLTCGEERLADSGKVIAQRAADQGVTVIWEQYEALPHCFSILPILNYLPQVERCLQGWADFCCQCVHNPAALQTKGSWINFSRAEAAPVDMKSLSPLPFEEVRRRMEKAMCSMLATFRSVRQKAKM